MSLGFTESINGAIWSQVGDNGIEIRIPACLPEGVRPRDLSVCIKDSCILVVSAGPKRIIQWRLYGPVEDETNEGGVEWMYEDDHLVIDLKKKISGAEWTNLLDLPVRDDDPLLASKEELNKMIAQYFPPQVIPLEMVEAGKEDEKKDEAANELDKLLEGAVKEVITSEDAHNTPADDDADEAGLSTLAAFLRSERRMMLYSEKTFRERLAEARALAEQQSEEQEKMTEDKEEMGEKKEKEMKPATSPEATNVKANVEKDQKKKAEEAARTIPLLEKMLALTKQIREIRCQRTTIDSFIEVIRLSIDVAMINHETDLKEPYESEEEKELTPTQLMTIALSESPLTDTQRLHFLRLAAIHHGHPQCISIMFGKYPDQPIGPYLMLRRALDDSNRSAEANHIVGDLFSSGSKYFVPMFPIAVFFYQRAAQLGYAAAMLSLAQLWSRGCTETSLLSDEEHASLKSIDRYHRWIQKAVDRGSGAAIFVQGCAYLNGEYGLESSYTEAKRLLDAAVKTGASVSQLFRDSNIPLKLDALRKEEEEKKQSLSKGGSWTTPTGSATGLKDSTGDSTKDSNDGSLTSKKPPSTATLSQGASSGFSLSTTRPVMGASEARLDALQARNKGARAPSGGGAHDNAKDKAKRMLRGGHAAAAARRMKFWERAGRVAVTTYGLFALCFPLRVMLLPYFYEMIGPIVKAIPWLGNPDAMSF